MSKLNLTMAVPDYDHVRDLKTGRVAVEGVKLNVLNLPVEEIFYRFLHFKEWDISELSFAKYCALKSQNDHSITAIPVFLSRMFRLSSMYVKAESDIVDPKQLVGKKVGIPEWAQTASIYTRGYLQNELGIPLSKITWIQAGVNQSGRKEKVKLSIPAEINYSNREDKSLNDLLLDGEIDAIFTARPPKAFTDQSGVVRRLFESPEHAEMNYFQSSKVFPIMHVVAIKQSVLDENPWVSGNLMKAFEQSKINSLYRASDITASYMPIPWLSLSIEKIKQTFGENFWPYGLAENRSTIEFFLKIAFEQGLIERKLDPAELFPKEVQGLVRV